MEWIVQYGPYALIPIISAFVGYITNVLALRMTFHPIEYIGLGPWIGWQGIVPSRAASMAEKSVDLMLGKLIDLDVEFRKIDPKAIAEGSRAELEIITRDILERIMHAEVPRAWAMVPNAAKAQIASNAARDLPHSVEEMMLDLQQDIGNIFDVKATVKNTLIEDKALLNSIFLECGEREFKFIARSGLYFGFLFGLVQMVIWYFYAPWWFLPLAGGLVGYLTNFLALKLIFQPVRPVNLGLFKIQGLFIKRQDEVAKVYARLVSERILNTKNIFENIMYGKNRDKLLDIITKYVELAVDEHVDQYPLLRSAVSGSKRMDKAKNIADFHFINHFPVIIHKISSYAEKALDLENTFDDRMRNLSPEEFQGFLRPVFQEDEWKLILVGAVLGMLAGGIQYIILF